MLQILSCIENLIWALSANCTDHIDHVLAMLKSPMAECLSDGIGTSDHSIAVWNVEKQEAVAQWTGLKALNSGLKWSPRRMLVASADSVLALWVPNKKLLQTSGRWQGP